MKTRVGIGCVLWMGIAVAVCAMLPGCATQTGVIAATGTNVGVDVSEKPQTGDVGIVLGYKRAEFAFVPTNKGVPGTTRATKNGKTTTQQVPSMGNGAADTADVLMELSYKGHIKNASQLDGGIYQRLAIGSGAVKAKATQVMLSKDATGNFREPTAAEKATAAATLKEQDLKREKIVAAVRDENEQLDQAKWKDLVDKASAADLTNPIQSETAEQMKKYATLEELQQGIKRNFFTVDTLYAQLDK